MPTLRSKAEEYVRSVSTHAAKERQRLGIARDDVDLKIKVAVTDVVTYDEHEDED
jgi:hypothetical protein